MALSSYTELKAAVASWATRTDTPFTSKVPDFIRLAEERINRFLRVSDMVSLPIVLTINAGLNYVALPTDWAGFKGLRSLDQPRIEYMPADDLFGLPPDGDATAYTVEGRRLYYGLTPSAALDLTVRYYQRVPTLSDSQADNWLLLKYPSIYLYGSLLEAYIWAKNPQKVGEYGTLFDQAIDAAVLIDAGDLTRGQTLRMRRA